MILRPGFNVGKYLYAAAASLSAGEKCAEDGGGKGREELFFHLTSPILWNVPSVGRARAALRENRETCSS